MSKNYFSTATIHNAFLFGVITVLFVLCFMIFSPFLTTLFMAAIVSTVVYPAVKWLENKKCHRVWAATSIFIGVILLIVIPVGFLLYSLIQEATAVGNSFLNKSWSIEEQLVPVMEKIPVVKDKIPEILERVNLETAEKFATDMASTMSGFIFKSATEIVKHISLLFVHTLVFLFSLFYFLLDGIKIVRYLQRLLPLSPKQTATLSKKIEDLMKSIIYGLFGASVAQGLTLGFGLAMVGINNPIFWATIGTLLAPIPFIGTGLIWIPATIYLFFEQQVGAGAFFLVWCLMIVVNIDNVVKPYLIGSKTMLHPFAVMITIIGGVLSFGFKGLVFGPLILTLLLAFLHIYELEHIHGQNPTGKKSFFKKTKIAENNEQ